MRRVDVIREYTEVGPYTWRVEWGGEVVVTGESFTVATGVARALRGTDDGVPGELIEVAEAIRKGYPEFQHAGGR